MYFLTVRKLWKRLYLGGGSTKREQSSRFSNKCLDKIPDSCRRYYRRLLLFLITVVICLYVVVYHKPTQDTVRHVFSVMVLNQLQLFTGNHRLPVCGIIVKRNGNDEQNKTINKKIPIDYLFAEVTMGGYYYPKKCRSRHKVAILVPYRKRKKHLNIFTYYMHPFLIKQDLEYRIFVIQQAGWGPFNRGKLFNVGFTEMMKYNDWNCVVLHDVDLLPRSDEILYTCPTTPRHMVGTVVDKANLTYDQYHTFFGGVAALTVQHYRHINGFSNLYWGWGGEDNDMYWRTTIKSPCIFLLIFYLIHRILFARLPIVRYNKTVAQYKSLPHKQQSKNYYRYHLLKFAAARYQNDGLSNVVYKVVKTKYHHFYTHILADINPLKENITNVYKKMFNN